MADLFTLTAPLVLVDRAGKKTVIAEKYPHPDGMLIFQPYWLDNDAGIAVVAGEIRGEGPWKVGEHVVRILSCGDADESMQWTMWQQHLAMCPDMPGGYHDETAKRQLAREYGAQT